MTHAACFQNKETHRNSKSFIGQKMTLKGRFLMKNGLYCLFGTSSGMLKSVILIELKQCVIFAKEFVLQRFDANFPI